LAKRGTFIVGLLVVTLFCGVVGIFPTVYLGEREAVEREAVERVAVERVAVERVAAE
jgi:hypothetical protein